MKSNVTKNFKRKADSQRAGCYKDGGSPGQAIRVGSGPVRGPGGPREDKIPAMLSDGEYVLPADVVKKIGVENLDEMLEAHHSPQKDRDGDGEIDEAGMGHETMRGMRDPEHYAMGGFVPSAPKLQVPVLLADGGGLDGFGPLSARPPVRPPRETMDGESLSLHSAFEPNSVRVRKVIRAADGGLADEGSLLAEATPSLRKPSFPHGPRVLALAGGGVVDSIRAGVSDAAEWAANKIRPAAQTAAEMASEAKPKIGAAYQAAKGMVGDAVDSIRARMSGSAAPAPEPAPGPAPTSRLLALPAPGSATAPGPAPGSGPAAVPRFDPFYIYEMRPGGAADFVVDSRGNVAPNHTEIHLAPGGETMEEARARRAAAGPADIRANPNARPSGAGPRPIIDAVTPEARVAGSPDGTVPPKPTTGPITRMATAAGSTLRSFPTAGGAANGILSAAVPLATYWGALGDDNVPATTKLKMIGDTAARGVGTIIGGAAGATAGSAVPVAGTLMGGVAGSVAGDRAGNYAGDVARRGINAVAGAFGAGPNFISSIDDDMQRAGYNPNPTINDMMIGNPKVGSTPVAPAAAAAAPVAAASQPTKPVAPFNPSERLVVRDHNGLRAASAQPQNGSGGIYERWGDRDGNINKTGLHVEHGTDANGNPTTRITGTGRYDFNDINNWRPSSDRGMRDYPQGQPQHEVPAVSPRMRVAQMNHRNEAIPDEEKSTFKVRGYDPRDYDTNTWEGMFAEARARRQYNTETALDERRRAAMAGEATARRGQDVTARGQDLNYDSSMRGHDVTARGQDLQRETAREGHKVTERGQDLQRDAAYEGHMMTAKTAALNARMAQQQQDFNNREVARKAMIDDVAARIPQVPGPDGKTMVPDTATATAHVRALDAEYRAQLEKTKAALDKNPNDEAAQRNYINLTQRGMASMPTDVSTNIYNRREIENASIRDHGYWFNPFSSTGVKTEQGPASVRQIKRWWAPNMLEGLDSQGKPTGMRVRESVVRNNGWFSSGPVDKSKDPMIKFEE